PMKIVEIIPRTNARVFGRLTDKQAAIHKKGRGTYERVGRKSASAARWRHIKFGGSVQLARADSESITAKIPAAEPATQRRLLASFLGFVDRHSDDKVATITIHYR